VAVVALADDGDVPPEQLRSYTLRKCSRGRYRKLRTWWRVASAGAGLQVDPSWDIRACRGGCCCET